MRFWKDQLNVTDNPHSVPIGFTAQSVSINNPTNQWVRVTLVDFVPPYTMGAVVLIVDDNSRCAVIAPIGQTNPPTITGQYATFTYYDAQLVPSPGVGILSQRAPYYDRAPLSQVFQYLSENIGPHAMTVRWSYTVPVGRKAYLEEAQVTVQLEAAGDLAPTLNAGFCESYISNTPSGAAEKTTILAYIQDKAPSRTRSDVVVGSNMELQPGDRIRGVTANVYTATAAYHSLNAKITEFDI